MNIRWTPHITVAAVAEHQGTFLMVQETINNRLVYNQPAGHWEAGETLLEAVIRETREETTWHFQPTALVSINQWQTPQQITYLRFCFCGIAEHPIPNAIRDQAITKVFWLDYPAIQQLAPQLRSPMVLNDIERYLAGHRYDLALLCQLLPY